MKTLGCTRREFLARTSLAGAGAALAMTSLAQAAAQPADRSARPGLKSPNAERIGWNLCCSIYNFRDRSFYEALEVVSALGFQRVEPAFFLPLSKEHPEFKTSEALNAEQRREMKKRMEDQGISMVNYYAPIEGDKSVYRKIFDFAQEMEVKTLVAEPPPQALEALDALCAEYKINLAIHNHPEGSGSHYWNPDSFKKACEGLSPRIGGCPDTGHWVRSGLNTLESLRKYRGRLLTVHLKDAAESGNRESRDVPLGTGKANYTALLNQIYDWKWRGTMTIEYEHLSPRLVEDIAQCVQFVEDFAAGQLKKS